MRALKRADFLSKVWLCQTFLFVFCLHISPLNKVSAFCVSIPSGRRRSGQAALTISAINAAGFITNNGQCSITFFIRRDGYILAENMQNMMVNKTATTSRRGLALKRVF